MVTTKMKQRFAMCFAVVMIAVNVMCASTVVFAENDLNEIGGSTQQTTVMNEENNTSSQTQQTTTQTQQTTTQTQQTTTQTAPVPQTQPANNTQSSGTSNGSTSATNSEAATAVGEVFKQGSLTQESVEKAKKWVEPVAKVLNLAMAIVLGILAALLTFNSVLDILFLTIAPVRKFLFPEMGAQGAQGGAMPMGGMMGGMMGAAQQQPVKAKNLIFAYMKKRSFTLIMLGICLVLFTCTVFTDIGTMLGMKLLGLLSGISL